MYLRLIGDRSIQEKEFGRIQIDRVLEMQKWAENIKNVQVDEHVKLAIVAANNHYARFGPGSVNIFRNMLGLTEAKWQEKDEEQEQEQATGYWVSKTLMSAFTKIARYQNDNNGESMTLREVQKIIGIEQSRPAEAFTTALVSLGLLKANKNNNDGEKTFANTEVSSIFLDENKPTYIGDVISMFDERLYKRWDRLSEALKTNKPVGEEQGEDIESI